MVREIISLHLGQAGVQVGNACWELYCLEHGVQSSDGSLVPDQKKPHDESQHTGLSTFFSETSSGKYVPRALHFDMEPSVIDQLRSGPMAQLYHPDSLISGREDACHIYSRGHYTEGRQYHEMVGDRLRRLTEQCDNLQGFVLSSAIGGGTGSGFGTSMHYQLACYAKKTKLDLCIVPSSDQSASVVEPYNAVLASKTLIDNSDVAIVLDNQAVYDICQTRLNVERPTYGNINRFMAQALTAATSSLHHGGQPNASLGEIQANLSPYPQFHFLLCSYAPTVGAATADHEQLTALSLTSSVFEPSRMLAKCDTSRGMYVAVSFAYRGDLDIRDTYAAIRKVQHTENAQFVDWSGRGFTFGMNKEPPTMLPGGDLAQVPRTCGMLSSSTAIAQVFSRLGHDFDLLYAKRAFVHWYVGEGMSEGEFSETRYDLETLLEEYRACDKVASSSSDDDDP